MREGLKKKVKHFK